jgi:uncharacterized protein
LGFTKNYNSLLLLKYFIIFYILWSFTEIVLYPFLRAQGGFLCDICSPIWKIIIWLGPVAFILKHKQYSVLIYLKLNNLTFTTIIWGLLSACLIFGYNLFMHALFYGDIAISPGLTITQWVNTVLVAGLIEEILFRGYFLQTMRKTFSFWKANVLVSLMFVSIHFPIWYVNADHIAHHVVGWLQLITFIFFFSILQGWLFRKSGSLWPCIMMHMMNNFAAIAFYG